MTEPRNKSEILSETAKTRCQKVALLEKYGYERPLVSKEIRKGLLSEEDSITLLTEHDYHFNKVGYRRNTTVYENDFIKGTPDIITDEQIIDIKTCWDFDTFLSKKFSTIEKNYYWQLLGYMFLCGVKKSRVSFCLVNTPDILLKDEEYRIFYNGSYVTMENKEYIDAVEKLRANHTFDWLPLDKRVHEIEVDYDSLAIESLIKRIHECREYIAGIWGKI